MINDKIGINDVIKKNIRGNYKIQLFDKNDKCIREYKKHNAISNYFYDEFRKYLYDTIMIDSYYLMNLYLTYDENTNSNDVDSAIVLGDLVGCANNSKNTYSESVRGIMNFDESETIYNKGNSNCNKIKSKTVHLVYDFPTSRGNGTFSDIYLGYSSKSTDTSSLLAGRNSINYEESFCISYDGNENLTSDRGSISHSDDHIYIQNCICYDGTIKSDTITKLDKINYEETVITLQVPSDVSSKKSIIVYACELFWRIASDFSVTRYNLDGSYKDRTSILNHFTTTTKTFDPYSCTFTGDNNYLYFTNSESLVSVDKDNIKKSEINKGTNGQYVNLIQDNSKTYIAISSYHSNVLEIYYVNESNGVLSSVSNFFKNTDFYYGFSFIILNGNIFVGYAYNYNPDYSKRGRYHLCRINPWTSHMHLDTPITKTSANTMKIQYDITIDNYK